jgi:pyruvate/2-oxoglutarate dehydrogenase complex dihydrolipoamide dehydrogenase (E3) component
MTGCETAQFIAANGSQVHLIEMLPDIATGAFFVDKMDMVQRLKDAKVNILTGHRLVRIKDGSIFVKPGADMKELELRVDKVVLSLGSRPIDDYMMRSEVL